MRISDQSKLLAACREATTAWQRYMDDTRPIDPDAWVALVACMSELVRVLAAIEKERSR